jgi:peroxiredoxin
MKKIKFTLFMVVLAAGVISIATSPEAVPADPSGYKAGDKAADFSLKNTDGKMISLGSFENAKGAIVIFTCNHCPYSVAYEDRIIALHGKYAPQGYPVIAINPNDPELEPDDSYEKMQLRAAEKGFPFPYLIDEGQKVYPLYGATRTPHVYVLSKSAGEYTVEYVGAIDDNTKDASKATRHYVEQAVDALLKGEKPEVTATKAIGCGIKAKGKE